jgi:phosphoenolpyruvate carboxylase
MRRQVNPQSYLVAIMGTCKLSADDKAGFVEPVRGAVDAIRKGQGTKDEWQKLFHALNMLEQFSRSPQIMRNARDYIESMQDVITGILDRKTKSLHASELADLVSLADLWEEVLGTVTMREYSKAEAECERRLVAILRSGTRGVRVVEIPK